VAETVTRAQVSRLRRWVYLYWPALWLGTAFFLSAWQAGAEQMIAVYNFIWGLIQVAFVVGALVGVLALVAKLATDFRNRRYRFPLNPGSTVVNHMSARPVRR